MSTGLFSKAMKDAGNFSINLSSSGRTVGGNAQMDKPQSSNNSRGGRGGRWHRGGRGRGRGGGGGGSYHPLSRFDDDDDLVMDEGRGRTSDRYNPYGGSSGGGGGGRERSRSPERKGGKWFKITIPDGAKHTEGWLMQRLQRSSTEPFEPKSFHKFGQNCAFFVQNESAANALKKVSNTITTKDGTKVTVHVKTSDPPHPPRGRGRGRGGRGRGGRGGAPPYNPDPPTVEISSQQADILKECLGQRYDGALVKIDLSSLHTDKVLTANNVEKRIWQPWLMNTILKLINEFCPQLVVLDLSNNRIRNLSSLRNLAEMCPNLEALNLANNELALVNELYKIKHCKKITKLHLNGNPCCDKYSDNNSGYVSDVREHMPGILELDGVVLPPPITFDLQSTTSLPPSKGNFSVNDQATPIIVNFLKQYFMVYDKENVSDRQQLLDAYHNEAVFSMVCNTSVYVPDSIKQSLNEYISTSRNLNRVTGVKRHQLIKHKKLQVVAALTELPRTKHQLDTLALDVPIVQQSCICFTVRGLFLEGDHGFVRAFTRTFVVVPESGSKLLIINDQLHVRSATQDQFEKYKSSSGTDYEKQTAAAAIEAPLNTTLTTEQQALVNKFALQSKMNLKWSHDALVQNNWNYEATAKVFTSLHAEGKIPPEAFVISLAD